MQRAMRRGSQKAPLAGSRPFPRHWSTTHHFRLASLTVRLRSTLGSVADEVARIHSHMVMRKPLRCDFTLSLFAQRPTRRGRLRYFLYEEDDLLYATDDRRELLPEVEMAMACGLVDHMADCVQVHGAAVAWNGVGMLLTGPPGAGKTTLVCALLAAGFTYLADEIVFFEPETLNVTPYHRALSIKAGSRAVLRAILPSRAHALERNGYHLKGAKGPVWYLNPTWLSPRALGRGGSIQVIITPSFAARRATPKLQPMARKRALHALTKQLISLPSPASTHFEALVRLVESSVCYQLKSGDARAAAAMLLDLAASLSEKASVAGGAK